MKTNDIFHTKAARYLAGEMDEQEKFLFERSNELASHIELFNQIKSDWNTLAMHTEKEKISTDRAWRSLKNRLEGEMLLEPQAILFKRNYQMAWLRVAAAVLLVAAIGSFWFILPNISTNQMVTITTGSESSNLFQKLPDGSRVYLGSNSTLTYPKKFGKKQRNVQLNGNGFFDIQHNPQAPFRIECNGKMVEVLGTSFNLSSSSDNFELKVESGAVRVFNVDNPANDYLVISGELLVANNGNFTKSEFSKGSAITSALKRIQFKDEPLGDIVNVLNQKFDKQIVFSSPNMANRKLTATFEGSSLDTIVEVICRSLNIESMANEKSIVLHEKGK